MPKKSSKKIKRSSIVGKLAVPDDVVIHSDVIISRKKQKIKPRLAGDTSSDAPQPGVKKKKKAEGEIRMSKKPPRKSSKKTKTVVRSSITGRFIKPSTAKRHPKTSIKQIIKPRLVGDTTTDAPPPEGKKRRKRKGK